VSRDRKTGHGKGFAYIQFSDADSAEQAMKDKDGQYFQGRILHVIAATAKREDKMNDFELSKLPLKTQQQIKKKREAASTTFNWNALYMNADTVVSSVAARLGLSKSEVLDPTSSDAAVKQAHAETHIIQETKSYFRSQGVDLDAFKRSQRGDTAILVKNIPYDCSKDELKRLFEEHGDMKRFIMPPSGTLAIIEFANPVQAKAAFGVLAYRKVKGSVLFLEKAPKDLFTLKPTETTEFVGRDGISKLSTGELKNTDADMTVAETSGTATLFVRNLNFDTSSQQLTETFSPLDGFLSARVKTRTDPKKPGQVLSMGFGFLEFQSSAQAQAALQAMDGYSIHGHKLQIRASHKGTDAAEQRRKEDKAKRDSSKKTKVVVKNLPFEATKKDVRSLLGAYGELRSVRVPKKMDRGARGFAFADFTTPKEAQNAIDALRDTHLLGRRLVLDFAEEEAEDAEAQIEKMQKKVGSQVNKVALQKLTSGGRKKFTTENDAEE
jgi:multiple RNA-binding domain-containing protein 1